jgi:hypothetical protein
VLTLASVFLGGKNRVNVKSSFIAAKNILVRINSNCHNVCIVLAVVVGNCAMVVVGNSTGISLSILHNENAYIYFAIIAY